MSLIYVGSDHRGLNLKNKIVEILREEGYQLTDIGPNLYNKDDDFNESAIKVAEAVVQKNGLGILICGSGVGMSVMANKVIGVRAALCTSEKQTRMAKEDNNANVLCLSADLVDEETNLAIVKVFLETVFGSEERFLRRINKIKEYEKTKLS